LVYNICKTAAGSSIRRRFFFTLAILKTWEYNELTAYQLAYTFTNNVQTDYVYRPDGLRHSKEVGGILTTHLWD